MKNTVSFLLLALASQAFPQTPPPALKVESIPNPSTPGSLQANLAVTQDGNPILSWVEPSKDGSFALRYALRQGTGWSEPRTIAANRKFFHHPAELPEVVALKGGSLLAHWIEMPSEKSEAEFLYVSGSRDGVHWNAPSMAHHDRSQAQHGLASIVASGDREASLFWLQALKGEDGPVSLMRTVIDAEGKEIKEESLDSDVCACCPTAVTRTTRGLLVAYRDHTPEDIRDISVTRFESGRWTSPKNVYADKWQLNACPINAASVSAKGDRVAISWYTAAGDKPRVELALSNDGGQTFGKPVTVSTGQAYGYTSIAIDVDGGALVSWLERGGDGARVLARHVGTDGAMGPVLQVAAGTRQNLGYPRLVVTNNQAWITWNAAAKAQTARLR